MLFAELPSAIASATEAPHLNLEFTLSGLGIIVAIVGCFSGGVWWFTKLFSQFQVSFAQIQSALTAVQTDLVNYKSSQDLKLDSVHVELKKQTEILIKQEVMSDRLNQMMKTQDRFQEHLDNLENAFRNFRVGSHISEQAQAGKRAQTSLP